MIPRKPLAPNNSRKPLNKLFNSEVKVNSPFSTKIKRYPEARTEAASIVSWAHAGRQNSEGFGGGNRVLRGRR